MRFLSTNKKIGKRLSLWLLITLILIINAPSSAHSARDIIWIDSVQSNQRYEFRTLHKYAFVYSDRDFVFTNVPRCLEDGHYVLTANSDKFSRGLSHLRIYSKVPVVVYIGYDNRYRKQPKWLYKNFQFIPNIQMVMGEPKLGKTQVTYNLYRKNFSPGIIELGGNLATEEKSNYSMFTVIIIEISKEKRCY